MLRAASALGQNRRRRGGWLQWKTPPHSMSPHTWDEGTVASQPVSCADRTACVPPRRVLGRAPCRVVAARARRSGACGREGAGPGAPAERRRGSLRPARPPSGWPAGRPCRPARGSTPAAAGAARRSARCGAGGARSVCTRCGPPCRCALPLLALPRPSCISRSWRRRIDVCGAVCGRPGRQGVDMRLTNPYRLAAHLLVAVK